MYIKPDEGLKSKLYENRNNIIAGIISHGFSNSRFVDYFGIIVGLLTGLIVVIPNFAEDYGNKFFISYDNFWPVFIVFIIFAIVIYNLLKVYIKNRSLKMLFKDPELMIDTGTVLYNTINHKLYYAILENDYKSPVPHYLELVYTDFKKPRMLNRGSRVYILKNKDSVCIIPMSDITGAAEAPEYNFLDDVNFDDLEMAIHPDLFKVDSSPRMITEENRTVLTRTALKRASLSILSQKCPVYSLWGALAAAFLLIIFHKDLSINLGISVLLIIAAAVLTCIAIWVFMRQRIKYRIKKADCVKTAFVENPKNHLSFSGNPTTDVSYFTSGSVVRKKHDFREASRNFRYFESVEVFYKKEIDDVTTIC